MSSIRDFKGLALTGFILMLVQLANAQLISVQSLLERDSLMIGEQVSYTLRIDAAKEVDFLLPAFQDTLSSRLEIIAYLGTDTLISAERKQVEHHMLITGFESGTQILPAQEVIYSRGEVVDTARSMPLILNIFDPVVDTTEQIKPIKPPINTPLTLKELLPWLAAGSGGLLLLGAAFWFLRRYLKRRKDPEGWLNKPLEPAHLVAFRELDKLKEDKMWDRGEVKQYYSRLTEITRHYIERQYDIPAMESTTEEILHAFQRANPDDSLLDEILKELLELADLVKFAREEPLPVDNQTHLNNAYIFVQKTFPLFYSADERKEANHE